MKRELLCPKAYTEFGLQANPRRLTCCHSSPAHQRIGLHGPVMRTGSWQHLPQALLACPSAPQNLIMTPESIQHEPSSQTKTLRLEAQGPQSRDRQHHPRQRSVYEHSLPSGMMDKGHASHRAQPHIFHVLQVSTSYRRYYPSSQTGRLYSSLLPASPSSPFTPGNELHSTGEGAARPQPRQPPRSVGHPLAVLSRKPWGEGEAAAGGSSASAPPRLRELRALVPPHPGESRCPRGCPGCPRFRCAEGSREPGHPGGSSCLPAGPP